MWMTSVRFPASALLSPSKKVWLMDSCLVTLHCLVLVWLADCCCFWVVSCCWRRCCCCFVAVFCCFCFVFGVCCWWWWFVCVCVRARPRACVCLWWCDFFVLLVFFFEGLLCLDFRFLQSPRRPSVTLLLSFSPMKSRALLSHALNIKSSNKK